MTIVGTSSQLSMTLMAAAHLILVAACAAIAIMLVIIKSRREKYHFPWPYLATNGWFLAFFGCCGVSHLTDLITVHWPAFWPSVVISTVGAAVAAAGTAMMLWDRMPALTKAVNEMHAMVEKSNELRRQTSELKGKVV